MKLDAIDIQIVRLLQENGRLTHEQLGREVHLSRPAVHERVRRLEQAGVLRGYRAVVDWEALGLPLTAFVWVRINSKCMAVGEGILALTSDTAVVEECHRVAGEWCLLVKTRSASSLALQELLDQILDLPGVQNTMTTVALSTFGETTGREIRAGSPAAAAVQKPAATGAAHVNGPGGVLTAERRQR
ncbi:MAG: Lrp/AsnC family transcriptional regulator [Armatimonadota bacterium]